MGTKQHKSIFSRYYTEAPSLQYPSYSVSSPSSYKISFISSFPTP